MRQTFGLDDIDREADRIFGRQKQNSRALRYRRAMESDAEIQWQEALKREVINGDPSQHCSHVPIE